jgi:hypothetical protein
MTTQNAEILGLKALGWLAGDPKALERFTDACAIEGPDLRRVAERPETIAAVLDFLLLNEDLLLGFCDTASVPLQDVHRARHCLDGEG